VGFGLSMTGLPLRLWDDLDPSLVHCLEAR
jgi:hypothetical protein